MYDFEFKKQPIKFLKNLTSASDKNKIIDFIEFLKTLDNPFERGKKLKGFKNRWRWRVGIYRIICNKIDEFLIIEIIEIIEINTREDSYKD